MALIAGNRVIALIAVHRKATTGTIIAESILQNRIEQDHRRIKQRRGVLQTLQVFRNAQMTLAGIELAHKFRKEKRKWQLKKPEDKCD